VGAASDILLGGREHFLVMGKKFGMGSGVKPSKFDLQIFQYESNYVGSTVIRY